MPSTATMLLLSMLAAPLLWVAARIVFSAYFAAKQVYQRQLLEHISRGGEE